MSYVKLHASILDSSMWGESDSIRIVWLTMLVKADQFGNVFSSVPGLAHAARVNIETCEEALKIFMAPDKYSRTKDYEGRRIQEIDGGWHLINHDKYRKKMTAEDRRDYHRKYMKNYREEGRDKTRPSPIKSEQPESDELKHAITCPINALRDWAEIRPYLVALLGENDMVNWGGLWHNRYKENPGKFKRVFSELELKIKEGAQINNPGGYASDLWERFTETPEAKREYDEFKKAKIFSD